MALLSNTATPNYMADAAAGRNRLTHDFSPEIDPEEYERQARLREDDTLDEALITDEIRDTTRRAIDRLSEEIRTTIFLHELDGLSYEEIAVTMDCPLAIVRSRIVRARAAIDAELSALLK